MVSKPCTSASVAIALIVILGTISSAEAQGKGPFEFQTRWACDPTGSKASRDMFVVDSQPLDIKTGSMIAFKMGPGRACRVTLDARFPAQINLEMTGAKISDSFSLSLEQTESSPRTQIPIQVTKVQDILRSTVALQPGNYELTIALPGDLAEKASTYQLKVSAVEDHTVALTARPGTGEQLVLEPLSGRAVRKLTIDRPVLVELLVEGTPPISTDGGLTVWRTQLRLDDSTFATIPPVSISDTDQTHIRHTYVLKPGIYLVTVEAEVNTSPHSMVPHALLSPRLAVVSVSEQRLPASMLALQTWLDQSGFGELLELTEFLDLRTPDRGLPGSVARLAPLAAEVGLERLLHEASAAEVEALRRSLANGDGSAWPNDLPAALRPVLVVSFRPKRDRGYLEETESAFRSKHSEEIWDRLLQEIASLEDVPTRRIIAWIPIECSAGLVYVGRNLTAGRHGVECMSASFSTLLADTKSSTASLTRLRATSPDLSISVPPFLKKFVTSTEGTASFEYLSTDSDYVEVIARGIRGHVIHGGKDWERLQLTFAETGGDQSRPLMLRVSVEGRIASGLGSFPPDSDFTREMDLEYSEALTNYAKRVGTALASAMGHTSVAEQTR